jgi:hypothetical protein
MKNKKLVLLSADLLSLTGFFIMLAVGSGLAESQKYNYAAERWSDSGDYAQISCFFPESSPLTTDSIDNINAEILSGLQDISVVQEEGQKLCPTAYSSPVGESYITGNRTGKSKASITAVGGDFFLIHNFTLLDGSFFSDDDIMQDGVVIDKNLAWNLYGSYEVAGMELEIDGVQFYVSGVIDNPETKAEKKCVGELPFAYISYDGASGFSSDDSEDSDGSAKKFKDITCYEVIMPDPVSNYAYNAIEEIMESDAENAAVVQNNGRFEVIKRIKAIKNISLSVVEDSGIKYPYWENAARIIEFRLSCIYTMALIFLILPIITIIISVVRLYKLIKKGSVLQYIRNKKYNLS